MTNLVRLDVGPKAPSDLSKQLREIADAIDRGEITALVAGLVRSNGYDFVYGASYKDCLEIASLLQYRCLKRYET